MLGDYKRLIVYQKAFELAMQIFELSKKFTAEEKYSLTDQVRRSSRSVCKNIAEAYRKRRYPAHFISKLSDVDMENSETNVWLEFSIKGNYLNEEQSVKLFSANEEIGKLLQHMMKYPSKFGVIKV
ncbi:MAG: four helix bundle protein [Saprospiraceae bacterium]|nr:four helix bundle protein [Saprospiraceae bacterium]